MVSIMLIGFDEKSLDIWKSFHDELNKMPAMQFILLLSLMLVVSYVLGHLSGSLSSFLYEKTIIGKVLQYPYKSIIFGKSAKIDLSSHFYRAIITLIFLIILLFVIGQRDPHLRFSAFNYEISLPLCSQVGLFLFIILISKWIDAPIKKNFVNVHEKYEKFLTPTLKIIGRPFYITERLCSHFSGQIKSFPDEIREKIKEKYIKVFGVELTEALQTEIFWSVYWHVTNQSSYVRAKVDKWLVLYSFMRNISCAALLSSIILALPIRFNCFISAELTVASIVLFILSFIFSFRYYYLYYGYYTKNVFRAFVFLDIK